MTIARLGLASVLLVACNSGGSAGPGLSDAGMDRAADVNGAAGGGGDAGTSGGGTGGAAAGTAGGAAGTTGGGGAAGAGGATAGAGGATAGAGGATAGAGGSRGGAGGTGGATAGAGGAAAGSRGGSGGGSGGGAGTTASSLRLEYQNSSATATMFAVRLTNLGPATPLISALKVRYYFLDDTTNRDATPMVTAAQWQIANPATTINLRQGNGCSIVAGFATRPQFSYIDFGCNLGSPMNAQDTITFSIAIDPATQLAANDYSYADTAGAFVSNDRLLQLLNGVVVAGTPP